MTRSVGAITRSVGAGLLVPLLGLLVPVFLLSFRLLITFEVGIIGMLLISAGIYSLPCQILLACLA